ncbi:MAG: glycosyltransferase, partial [Elusimicrobiota bacterium]
MPDTEITVIIITRNRPEMLGECLGSVLASLPENIEILAGINGPDDRSLEILARFPRARAVPLPALCRGEARNAVAAKARGRRLCFLDDDTVIPEGYFTRLLSLIERNPDAAVFGGGQLLFSGAGFFERLVYLTLGSAWGAGPFTERFSPVRGTRAADREKFVLCNLTLDRFFLEKHGLAFEGHVTSAEENLLLNRMAAAGARMILSADLNLIHRRRKNLRHFIRQVFGSGRGRAQISFISPGSAVPFTFLPPLAACSFIAAFFLPGAVLAVLSGTYFAASLAFALNLDCGVRLKAAAAALFPALHGAYACGWLFGAAESVWEKFFRKGRP